jgi:hypothetical protein
MSPQQRKARDKKCKTVTKLYWKKEKEILRRKKKQSTARKALGPCLVARRH